MKTAIICPICEKPKRESESYSVKIRDYRLSKIFFDESGERQIIRDAKTRVCRPCTKRMGYKVKKTVAKIPISKPGGGDN